MSQKKIPFNIPFMTGKELQYIADANASHMLAGDGAFTRRCHEWLRRHTGANSALLTHSCTAALEMSALLLNLEPGDEVIMPSYTFVSTANAFALRGAVPVFVDIRNDTLNIDETLIEAAITPRTKAIVVVHYAGVACEMDTILSIAQRHGLHVVEDAAQGVMARYKGRPLGSIADLGAYSFHETKNIISGEGGALMVRDATLSQRAEIVREKGTNRSQFFRGQVDKYTWQDIGSSFLPGEIIAAFLWAQLEEAEKITELRLRSWELYHRLLKPLEDAGHIRRPVIPETCEHNAHMYYILLSPNIDRTEFLRQLRIEGIGAVFHYVPLHESPAGMRYSRNGSDLSVTSDIASRVVRLPLWIGITEEQQARVVSAIQRISETFHQIA